ncbi:hypothetical protein QFZ20_004787 [Flavobacterium sp. W4I14]|nr:hypothetical protein [Flavobacterium sp. W4I14]
MKQYILFLTSMVLLGCRPEEKQTTAPNIANQIFFSRNPTYSANAKELLSEFKLHENDTTKKIVLICEPIKFEDVANFLEDSTGFTPFEIQYIKNETKYLSKINFDDLGERIVITPNDSIKPIFQKPKAWNVLHKKYGGYILRLSHPIFLRNYNYCILYLNYICGGLCGEEQIRLYRKNNKKWEIVKIGYGWIS